jgi:3',5'-nucleoside bisphosphate phosphatase
VVGRAASRGLRVLGLTDHDTLGGLAEARAAGERLGIRVIPGIELSSRGDGMSVHVLGYFPDVVPQPLADTLARVISVRENRNHAILERLRQLGVPVEWDDVVRRARGTVGRPHIAEAMVDAGYCVDRNDAFARYLADDAPAYVPTAALTPEQAVSLIAESGGAPVLAHPAHLHLALHALSDYVDRLVAAGLRGIEAYRPEHEPELRDELAGLAARRGLAATAGSDFHRPPVVDNPDLGQTGPVPDGYDPLPALGLAPGSVRP